MKIRYKTWYWGKYIEAESLPQGADSVGDPAGAARLGFRRAEARACGQVG